TATQVEIHALGYNSDDLAVIAVNDFGGGMWHRARRGEWRWKPNGSDGILFWTPPDFVEPWRPEFADTTGLADGAALSWFIDQAHFADDALTVTDQRLLSRALLLAPFFPRLTRCRPVQAHLGLSAQRQHDTGKTMAGKMIGALLVGPNFQPTPIDSTEKG